jgi:photosystem II stability/assembly factor-like uncharacterized protein
MMVPARSSVRLTLIVFLAGAELAAAAARAQVRWLPLGPEGGPVRAVAAASNGRTLYAGVSGGEVFRSPNRGRTWIRGGFGLRGALLDAQNAEVAPAAVYALTTEGVFASFDAARTWAARSRGLPDGPFDDPLGSLVVAPSNPVVLYVIARPKEGEFFAAFHQVYRSVDAGASWTRASRGLPDGFEPGDRIFDLAIDPTRPQVVYAATSHGVFKTTNGGRRWSPTGLTDAALLVAVDGVRPDFVYAASVDRGVGAPQRIQVSTDGGRTWRERTEVTVISLETHPAREGTAYAVDFQTGGLLETTDAGATWKSIGADLPATASNRVNDIAIDPTRPDFLYAALQAAGTDPGLFRSGDGGDRFVPSAAGIVATSITSLAIQPGNPGAVFAGLAQDGVHRLDVATGTWTQLGLDGEPVVALIVDPAAPETFYAVADAMQRVYRSTDGAATWELLSTDDFATTFRTSLAVVNGVLWTGGFNGLLSRDPGTGLWEQRYFTESREVAGAGTGPAARLWFSDASTLDAGGGNDGLWVSNDAGATAARSIFPAGEILDIELLADGQGGFGIGSPGLGRHETGRVFLTDDGGATWRSSAVASDAPPIFALARDPLDPQHVFAGSRGAVFESQDGGATWLAVSRGLARGAVVSALLFDELGEVYAATLGGGVFRLRDLRP